MSTPDAGSAEAYDGVSQQGVRAQKHHGTTGNLYPVADEHDTPLRHGIGKCTDKAGQDNVGKGEKGLEQRLVFGRRLHFAQGKDGCNQECIFGQR